ncbi:MAG: UMP kinase [Oligoflexia bacterium]|nr:UMP kinase [Bdellovibrionales bacterium]MYE07286.1 UMP kinase [Oligoflexia bacterium]
MNQLKYKRILIKVSGEILSGKGGFGIHSPTVSGLAEELVEVHRLKVQLALVVGGGNIFRGTSEEAEGMDRAGSDYMGMLATCINALALQDAIEKQGVETRVQTALCISEVAEPYIRRKALRHLHKHRIVIFAAGTGNPYFTTDTAAALRAMEMDMDILLKATKVDGVYEEDPEKNKNSKKYDKLKYIDILNKGIKIMDSTAVSLCMDNQMPLIAFNLRKKGSIVRIVKGEKLGTLIY